MLTLVSLLLVGGSLGDLFGGGGCSSMASSALPANEQPPSGGDVGDAPAAEAAQVSDAIVESSESAFHLGMLLSAGLLVVGGAVALLGVRNPERPEARQPALSSS
jgi:hypothetical protein